MPIGGKNKKHNRLWRARKRRRLRQKQVASLLGHRTVDQVSRFEKGTRMPTLEVALMLEIIYRVPLRLLFADLYGELYAEIRRKIESSPNLRHLIEETEELRQAHPEQFCSYAEVLGAPAASQADLVPVYSHVRELAKKLSRHAL